MSPEKISKNQGVSARTFVPEYVPHILTPHTLPHHICTSYSHTLPHYFLPWVQRAYSCSDGLAALAAAATGEAGDEEGQEEAAQAQAKDGEVSNDVSAVIHRLSTWTVEVNSSNHH